MAEETNTATVEATPAEAPVDAETPKASPGDRAAADSLAKAGIAVEDAPAPMTKPEAKETPETPAAEEESPTPKAKGLDERHARYASRLGYSPEEIAAMDPAVFNDVLETAAAQLSTKLNERASRVNPDPAAAKGGEAKPAEEGQDQPAELPKFEEFDAGEELSTKLNQVVQFFSGKLKGMDDLQARFRAQDEAAEDADSDRFFQALAKDFKQYGERRISDYAENAPEVQSRNAVVKRARAIQTGWKAEYAEALPWGEALDLAANQIHKEDIRTQARRSVQEDLEKRRRGAVPAAGARKPAGAVSSHSDRLKAKRDNIEAKYGVRIPDED